MSLLAVAVLFAVLGCSTPAAPASSASEPSDSEGPTGNTDVDAVFIGVEALLKAPPASLTLLDARDGGDFRAGHLPGAQHLPWEDFVAGPHSGALVADLERVRARLERAGVSAERPVVVYGAWDAGWGEEGRIYWMLEYLGHRNVRVLRGGVAAYRATGRALSTDVRAVRRGRFPLAVRSGLRATTRDVRRALSSGDAVIVDTRSLAEYGGLTPHGSPRGGHIPRAVHLAWTDLLDEGGGLRPRSSLRARFAALGIGADTPVIAYCTGGVRSGFLFMVMRWAGYGAVRNYDASFWEWSRRDELPVAR